MSMGVGSWTEEELEAYASARPAGVSADPPDRAQDPQDGNEKED